MAKPDWGELQQRFLSEHAATGVSPKEWCEAQGLNYATARRYIKKTSAQTAQKSAQKKVRIAQKEQSANELTGAVLRLIVLFTDSVDLDAAFLSADHGCSGAYGLLLRRPGAEHVSAHQRV